MYRFFIEELNQELSILKNKKAEYEQFMKENSNCNNYWLRRHPRNGVNFYYKLEICNNSEHYIGPSDHPEVKRMQKYRYMKAALLVIDSNIAAIDRFLSEYMPSDFASIIKALPPVYSSLQPSDIDPARTDGDKWVQQMKAFKATLSAPRPEDLVYETIDGNFVRSKSEMLIYNYLLERGIPFVYELPMRSGNGWIYPDFTIYDPATGKLFIWEHGGMMYDQKYYNKQFYKLCEYANLGYHPYENLFFTFDRKDGALSMKVIINVAKNFQPDIAA